MYLTDTSTFPCSQPPARDFGLQVARDFGLPPQLGALLYHRGHTTLAQVKDFLHPHLSMLPSPETMKGMQAAVSCIIEQMRLARPIFIHGDYDVDGITATALLVTFFAEAGRESVYYIPDRLRESYGLSKGSIEQLTHRVSDRAGGLLISVDCGISAVDEIAYARSLGLRVIVTDHHQPPEQLPEAEAILNPKQPGCAFPAPQLAGVGVAFFLIVALRRALVAQGLLAAEAINLKKYLDLVALGTVADVVPLTGVNRILVKAGLEVLSAKQRVGVFALCEHCSLSERDILSEDIAFKLAPRINAAGRLGTPHKGVELLLARSLTEARSLAAELEQMNSARKELEQQALPGIDLLVSEQLGAGRSGLTLYQQGCHPGVLGILASRVVDRCRRPVIVFTDDHQGPSGGLLKGSGRSVQGMNLFQVLECCSPWIEQFGGHAMAVGLTIRKEAWEQFAQAFDQHTAMFADKIRKFGTLKTDIHLPDAQALTKNFVKAVQLLQPFGEGNSEPTFYLARQQLLGVRDRNGHLLFQLQGGDQLFSGIGFRQTWPDCACTRPVNLVFQLKRSWFKGVGRDQVQALQIITS